MSENQFKDINYVHVDLNTLLPDENNSKEAEPAEENFFLPTSLEEYKNLSRNFYAGFWIRVIAYVIDMIVVLSLSRLFNTLTFNVLGKIVNIPIVGEIGISEVIILFSYNILMIYFLGQTLGKMAMKIVVKPNKPGKLSLKDVVYREFVGKLLNMGLSYLPYLSVAFTTKKLGLHDYIADTVVIKEDFVKIREQMNEKIAKINQKN